MDRKKGLMTIVVHVLRFVVGWHFLYEGVWKLMQKGGWSCLSYLDNAQGPLAGLFKWMASQGWIVSIGDWAVMLGLTLIGLSLMTGVLARVAAFFGILLMLMFYSAQPPEPFATAMSGADGRFFLLERNMIEIAALGAVIFIPAWRGWKSFVPGVLVLAIFGGCFWNHYKTGGFAKSEAITSATVKVHEFTALAALKAKLEDRVRIGNSEISRLALGGDLFAGHAHGRDLIWPDEFMRRYNQGGTLERTIRFAVKCGIDTIFAEPQFMATVITAASEVGGKMNYFVNCGSSADVKAAQDGGAAGVYLRPEMTDKLVCAGDKAGLAALFAALKASKLPVGIGAENVASVKACVANGLVPDFWVLAFHSLEYPAATLKTGPNIRWCDDPTATAAYMKTRAEPWVSIRGLAGGAIKPKDAYAFARANGVDAVAIDLLDFRIVDTINGVTGNDGKKETK